MTRKTEEQLTTKITGNDNNKNKSQQAKFHFHVKIFNIYRNTV